MRLLTRQRLRVATISVLLVLFASGCGDNLPTEADLPPEANLAYPGAIEISRSFDEGETGTYIDGGSADRAPRLKLSYEVDGATNEEILNWYEESLTSLGWVLDRRGDDSASFDRDPEGDLSFGFGVVARTIATSGTYSVIVVVAREK